MALFVSGAKKKFLTMYYMKFKRGKKMDDKKMICGATGEICPFETDKDGLKPCKKECEIGKEFLKNYIPLHDE